MQHTSNFGFCLFRTKRHKIGTMHESSYYSIKKVHEMSQYQPHDRPPFPPLLPFLFTVLSAKLPSHSHVHLLLLLLLLRPWHITLASPQPASTYILLSRRESERMKASRERAILKLQHRAMTLTLIMPPI